MTGKGYAPRAPKPFPIMGTALLPRMIMEDSGAGCCVLNPKYLAGCGRFRAGW